MPRGITQGGYPGGLPKGVTQEDCLRMCGVSQGSYPGELLRRITWECGELPRFLLSFGLFYVAEGGCLGGLIMRDACGGYQLPSGVSPGGYPERVTQSGLLSCVSSYGQHSTVCHTLCNPRVCHTTTQSLSVSDIRFVHNSTMVWDFASFSISCLATIFVWGFSTRAVSMAIASWFMAS